MKPMPKKNDGPEIRQWLSMRAAADRPGVVAEAVTCPVCAALVAEADAEDHATWHWTQGQIIAE